MSSEFERAKVIFYIHLFTLIFIIFYCFYIYFVPVRGIFLTKTGDIFEIALNFSKTYGIVLAAIAIPIIIGGSSAVEKVRNRLPEFLKTNYIFYATLFLNIVFVGYLAYLCSFPLLSTTVIDATVFIDSEIKILEIIKFPVIILNVIYFGVKIFTFEIL